MVLKFDYFQLFWENVWHILNRTLHKRSCKLPILNSTEPHILSHYTTHLIPYFQNVQFVGVSALVGQYFYNIVNSLELCLPLLSRTILFTHVYIILDFPITYRNTSVLCKSECSCPHRTVNMAVLFVKRNETTYQKGRALMQLYRVVPQMKRE